MVRYTQLAGYKICEFSITLAAFSASCWKIATSSGMLFGFRAVDNSLYIVCVRISFILSGCCDMSSLENIQKKGNVDVLTNSLF